jgi:nuclear pore complex protein Nup188
VKNIKADALWLSQEAKIAETEALRLVVLEWQSRAKMRLLSANAREESDPTKDMSLGNSFQSSFLARSAPFRSSIFNPDGPDDGFNTTDGLKSRLLRLYLTERLHVLRTADLLMRHYMESRLWQWDGPHDEFVDIGRLITQRVCHDDLSSQAIDDCLGTFTIALSQRVGRLESGSGWYTSEGGRPDLEAVWLQTQVDELVPILQLFFCVLDRVYATAQSTTAFFSLMDNTSFFDFSHSELVSNFLTFRLIACANVSKAPTLCLFPRHGQDPRGLGQR